MPDTQKYYDALANFELHYTYYSQSSDRRKEEREDHDRCFALLESLIHRNVYLEKQLEEWKRVAKVKEEQNTELRNTIARSHSDMHTLERLKHED